MKQSVFINYRRSDVPIVAQFVENELSKRFGAENIFFDREIEPGSNYVEVLKDAVGNCHILLALIGPAWLNKTNKARLHSEDDWVRIEIATALSRKTKVIPVYVKGAKIPKKDDLPPDLAGLTTAQAVFLKGDDIWTAMNRLLAVIEKDIQSRESEAPASINDRIDALLREARLLKTEADQIRLSSMSKSAQFRFGNEGATPVDLRQDLGEFDDKAHKAKLAEAHELLKRASELDPANTEVMLATAELLIDLTPEDTADEQRLFIQVKSLLSDPKNETEQFQLAKATYYLASSGGRIHEESIMDARAIFEQLGRRDWARRCDELLESQPDNDWNLEHDDGPHETEPPQTVDFPQPLTQFQPVGSWRICDSAFYPSTWDIRFFPNGGFQGQQETPAMGISGPVTGTWGFDPYQSAFHIQGVLNGMMPFGTTIFVQRHDGEVWYGVGADGMPYNLNPIAT